MDIFDVCELGFVERLNELIKNGINISQKRHGSTLLHIACYYNNIEIVKTLLENNVCVKEKNWCGDTAFETAVKHNKICIIKLFLEYGFEIDFESFQCQDLSEEIKEVIAKNINNKYVLK